MSPAELKTSLYEGEVVALSRRLEETPKDFERWFALLVIDVLVESWRRKHVVDPLQGAMKRMVRYRQAVIGAAYPHWSWSLLSGIDLTDTNFAGFNFEFADIEDVHSDGASLSGGDLTNCIISNLQGYHADFSSAIMKRTMIRDSILCESWLDSARLEASYLVRVDLGGSSLKGAYLTQAIVAHVDLTEADMTAAELSGTLFYRCVMKATKVAAAKMGETYFIEMEGLDVDLGRADVELLYVDQSTFDKFKPVFASVSPDRIKIMGDEEVRSVLKHNGVMADEKYEG